MTAFLKSVLLQTLSAGLCILLFAAPAKVSGQEYGETNFDELPFKNSFFTGGSLGLQLGTVTMIDVSPQFGYYPFEYFSVGTGFTYQYISDRRYIPRADINVYGGRLFSRFYLPFFPRLFAHGEIEYLWYRTNVFNYSGEMEWIEVPAYLLGAGFRQSIGGRSGINLMVLWNFNETQYTLSSNPVIRVGVDIGL